MTSTLSPALPDSQFGAGANVLIDLDGPLTRLFPSPSHLELAHALSVRSGLGLQGATDHVQVLRAIAKASVGRTDRLLTLEDQATRAEQRAARVAKPARGAADFLSAVKWSGARVGVVSNNATSAVRVALTTCGFSTFVDTIAARDGADDVLRLKPEPDLLYRALAQLGGEPGRSVFFGDTPSDMTAAAHAGVDGIGVSDDPCRAAALLAAGALTVVPDLGAAVGLLRREAATNGAP